MQRKITPIAIPLACILFLCGCISGVSSDFEVSSKNEESDENIASHFLFAENRGWELDESLENALPLDAHIDWVAIYPSNAKCIISLSDVSRSSFEDYIEKLCDGGFIVVANDKSKIDDGSHTLTNMLLSCESISVNLTYNEGNLVIYLGM